MTVAITETSTEVIFTIDGEVIRLLKDFIETSIAAGLVVVDYSNTHRGEVTFQLPLNYLDVTTPVVANADELKNAIDAMLAGSGTPGGAGDVAGPASAVDNNFAAFDTITGKLIKDSGYNYSSFQTPLGYTPENVANKSTDVATDQASNLKYPSVKAVFDWATGAFTTAAAVIAYVSGVLGSYLTTAAASATYLTIAAASATYQAIGSYLTTVSVNAPLTGNGTPGSPISLIQKSIVLGTTTSSPTNTGSVTNNIVHSILVPAGTVGNNDFIEITGLIRRTAGATGTGTLNVYFNDTNDLTTPQQVATVSPAATQTGEVRVIQKWINTNNATVGFPMHGIASVYAASPLTTTIDNTAAFYIIFTIQNTSALDTFTLYFGTATLHKT